MPPLRLPRAAALGCALAALLGAPALRPAVADGPGGDTPPVAPGDAPPGPGAGDAPAGDPPPDPAELEKKKRIELDRRRDELPDSARPALALLDRFRDKDFRVWGTLRNEVVALGADAFPALFVALEETDWETRAFAASCLGDLRARTAVGHLSDAYDAEKYGEGRRQMVIALAAIESPAAQATLVRALRDPEVGVRLAALHGLAVVGDPGVADAIRAFADDEDLDLRYTSRGALAAQGDEATITKLVEEARALVDEKRESSVDSLVTEDNGDRYSQFLLGLALSRIDDWQPPEGSTDAAAEARRAAEKILVAAMTADKPYDKKDFLRMGAAVGLGMRAGRTGIVNPKLASGIGDRDDRVRVACSFGAGFAKTPELIPRLQKALADSQMDVRYNAVTALGRIGGDEAAAVLGRGLKDRADEVRVGTVRALGLVRAPAATKALLQALRDDKYMIRVLAARQLSGRTAEPDVLDGLSRAAGDQDYGVREAALAALAHHPDGAKVQARITGALDDPDWGVQANACLALAKIGPATPAVAEDASAAGKVVALYLRATQRKLHRAAEECLDAVRPPGCVLPLIDGLLSDVHDTRKRANLALLRVSESSGVGYDPDAPKGERDAAARRWKEWWQKAGKLPPRGSRIRAAVTGPLVDAAKDLKWKGLDIALLFDSTGSMRGLINAAKERIDELVAELHELLPSVRVSVYTYRDHGDNYLFYGTPLTFDTWKIQAFLQYADAGQGGDLPEAVYETVKNCAQNLRWREESHKVVVYAGDASHHREQDADFMSFIGSWFTEKAHAALHALFTDAKRRSLDIKARKKRDDKDAATYPVFEVYKRTAEAGRGRAVMLDDESALMKDLLVLTFGEEWRTDIENLLDFER